MDEFEKSMENDSSHSWWLDYNTNNRLHQSQWLQSTLSDLENKVKRILSLIGNEDDGDTFAQRAEMFYKKRPLLIKSLKDLHQSYKLLAEKYDQLMVRYENIRVFTKLGSPAFANPNRFFQSSDHHDHDQNSDKKDFVGFDEGLEEGWDEMRLNVMKLIEDNLEQQAELVKRNDRKREALNEMGAQVKKLLAENAELKTKLGDIKRSRSQLFRAKDLILKKIMPESRN